MAAMGSSRSNCEEKFCCACEGSMNEEDEGVDCDCDRGIAAAMVETRCKVISGRWRVSKNLPKAFVLEELPRVS